MRYLFAYLVVAILVSASITTSAVATPYILDFHARSNDLLLGESVTLEAQTSGAGRVLLQPNGITLSIGDFDGIARVTPTQTTIYELVVLDSGLNELERQAIEVRVRGAYRVNYFYSSEVLVGRNEPVTLSWYIGGEFDSAEILGVTEPSDEHYGSITVVPGESRDYELLVRAGDIETIDITHVEVSQEFEESRFFLSYSPDEIQPVAPGLGVFTPFTVHVLAVSLEGTGIRGFEFGIDMPEGAEILGVDYHTDSVLNIVSPPDFIVGYGVCWPTSNSLYRVATLNIIAMDEEVIDSGYISLRPAVVQSIPDRLAYVTCANGLEGSEYSSASQAVAGPPLYLSPQEQVPTLQLGFRATKQESSVRLEWGDLPYPLVDRLVVGRAEVGMPSQPLVSFRGEELLELRSYVDRSAPLGVELDYVLRAYDGQELLSEESATMSANQWELPTRTSITGNFPNPFNPETTIRFDAAEAGTYELRIVDAAGRRVRQLERVVSGAGSGFEIRWDGLDGRGMPAASGVYFVELRGPNVVDHHRIALIK